MAKSSGPFRATDAGMAEGKAYLRERGIVVHSNNPTYVRRIANGAYKEGQAGLAPNRQASRGHGSTREHKNRPAPRELAPTRQEVKPTVVPTAPASPKEYRKAHYSIPKEQRYQQVAGREIYKTTSGKRAGEIIKFEADVSEPGSKRVDIKVTYADGTEQTLFAGADHKRSGEHAISVDKLDELLDDYDGDFDDYIGDVSDEEAYEVFVGSGGVVAYTITIY